MPNKLIHQGKLIAVYEEPVKLRNGGETCFDIVKHPGGAVIAAVNDKNELCLLKQWRHAVQETIWELPAGCLEPGEPPLKTAQRELEEEAGITAEQWQDMGTIIPSPGFSDERLYLFKATGIKAGTVKLDDAEQLEAHWVPLKDALEMARSGEIQDAKTLSLLLRMQAN